MKKKLQAYNYAPNAVHRFWANGQNFIATLLASSETDGAEITESTTVKELLDLTKRKMKEFPLI